MTSGQFTTIPLSSISINREQRQRRSLEGIEELALSIKENGLIHPPIVTREYDLVAGERRLTAMLSLGWTDCPVQWADTLDPLSLHLLELEENVRRVDLPWPDQTKAVATYHRLRAERDGFTIAQSAAALGVSESQLGKQLHVQKVMEEEPALLKDAEGIRSAYNIASRRTERKKAALLTNMLKSAPSVIPQQEGEPPLPAPSQRRAAIETADFIDWSSKPQDRFNLIHCDFPYGVSVGDKIGQSGAKNHGTYDDSKEVYFRLLDAFCENQDNFIEESAHLIFWFSQKFYYETRGELENAGWRVDPFMLIWHKSDNAGIIPDTQRGGRRTYETAFFASRGDRKIVKPVAMSYSGETTKQFHTSEKPFSMLQHFFRMVLDDTTTLLDPTAGSGMSVRVAEEMGAARALGLELNEEFAATARLNCKL